jgi:hypothetical protein
VRSWPECLQHAVSQPGPSTSGACGSARVLSRIAAQETRHIAFYASQARERLGRSRKAQRITRFALRSAWQPVGSGVMPASEVRHHVEHLLSDDAAEVARRVDAKIDTLPGLQGMRLVEGRVRAILAS